MEVQLYAESYKMKVGVITALTGRTADYGISIKNSISLAKMDFPNKLNNIEFIFEDAGYDTKASVNAFKKLTEIDHVDLIYVWGAMFCKAIAPIAETGNVPTIAQCVDPSIGKDRKFIIRFMNYSDEYMEKLLETLRAHGQKKFAVITAENAYLEEMLNAFKRSLESDETVTLIDQFKSDNLDFRSSLLKVQRGNFDSIGVFLAAGQISTFYTQMKEQRISKSTFGTNFFESFSEIKASHGAMNGSIYTHNTVTPFFKKHYEDNFNDASQLGFGALAYEFAVLVGDLFNISSKKLEPVEIINSFTQVKGRIGTAAGPYTYIDSPVVGKYFHFPIELKEVTTDGYKSVNDK